uniref:Putative salivary kunitz domain protein n=1 Tax=Ixodes ricinus TaxID=34613 RepID=A0A0K8RL93_IXORI
MKLLLIAVVISIHTTGFLTTAKAKCDPMYDGGRGGPGGANVKAGWSFNSRTNHCETVMYRSRCPPPQNCFLTKEQCEENCDPLVLEMLKQIQ